MLVDQYGKSISSVPVDTNVSDEVQKAVTQATGELWEKIERVLVNSPDVRSNQPKGFYVDPFAMLDSVGMGYRANPSRVTYETLRQMTEQNTLLGAIVRTRVNQVTSFCQAQENKYSVGHVVRFVDPDKRRRRLTNGERDQIAKISYYIKHMGQSKNSTRDGLAVAMKKMVADRLTYDQVNWENHITRGGHLFQSLVMDPATVRIADQSKTNPTGRPIDPADEATHIMYAQVMNNGEVCREFTARELAFCIANPRSSVKIGGYGFPEPQILIQTVTAHIWAEEWNRRAFSQGSTVKGVFNIKGTVDRTKYEAFKRQWMQQVGGITNAWRTPIINSDGIEFMPMQMSNTEMGYQMWIEYLVKIACAIYQMDPTEINFDLRGGVGQQPVFMSNNESQQKMSKDRGLKPLLAFFQDSLNRNIVSRIDDNFELAFVGLDAKSEEQAVELRTKQGQTFLTLNELRALEDMDPLPNGNIVVNPVYTGYLTQMQQQQGAQQPQQPTDPMAQPFGNAFGSAGDAPTAGAQQGKQRLTAMSAPKQPKEDTEHDDIRMLQQNDWSSTVHASLKSEDNDLRKSLQSFFEIELD